MSNNNSNSNSDLPILTHHVVDKSQVPSIDQKRMLAFINHFILNTVDFLNKFIANCETKFIEFDTKLQKIESSLVIVESKLASMPDVNGSSSMSKTENVSSIPPMSPDDSISPSTDINANSEPLPEAAIINVESKDEIDVVATTLKGIKIINDVRYKKYFKMMQMGVPAAAVKIKMQIEGYDGHLLDDPNRILEDGVAPDE